MSNTRPSTMVSTKNKVISCSTPERCHDSPSKDESDSLCESDAASPVPFLCTQDGAEGETDVVWNFYTPKSEHGPASRRRNSTPLSRQAKKSLKPKINEKMIPKRKPVRASTQKNTELFQELMELNQNLHELIAKKSKRLSEKPQSGSDDDIFNVSGESPKSFRTNSRCLRRNLLSSKFGKPETETALESDDSMNECLVQASQVVEDNILNMSAVVVTPAKRPVRENCAKITNGIVKPDLELKMDQNSMDAILNSIKFDSPMDKKKKCDSPQINNESFDSFFGNLNDSVLERLTQMPVKSNGANSSKLNISKDDDWTVQELVIHDESPPSKLFFGRHSSMPESPSVPAVNKPSTSGMCFGRYKSMPVNDNDNQSSGDSPIRCTPDEIKRKHQQAREKLFAKRLLPFTSTQPNACSLPKQPSQKIASKKMQFQPKVASSALNNQQLDDDTKTVANRNINSNSKLNSNNNSTDLRSLIEKKRQEALLKLRRRQPQNKMV